MKVRELIRKLEQLDPNMDVEGNYRVEHRQYSAMGWNEKKVLVIGK